MHNLQGVIRNIVELSGLHTLRLRFCWAFLLIATLKSPVCGSHLTKHHSLASSLRLCRQLIQRFFHCWYCSTTTSTPITPTWRLHRRQGTAGPDRMVRGKGAIVFRTAQLRTRLFPCQNKVLLTNDLFLWRCMFSDHTASPNATSQQGFRFFPSNFVQMFTLWLKGELVKSFEGKGQGYCSEMYWGQSLENVLRDFWFWPEGEIGLILEVTGDCDLIYCEIPTTCTTL